MRLRRLDHRHARASLGLPPELRCDRVGRRRAKGRNVQRHPIGLERRYEAELARYVSRIGQIAMAEVERAAPALVVQAGQYRPDDVSGVQPGTGWPEALRAMLARILAEAAGLDGELLETIRRMQADVDAFSGREWRRVLRRAYGVDIFAREPALRGLLDAWEMNNTALIKSVPQTLVTQMQSEFGRALARGTTTEELARITRERLGVAKSRARLIARDQVAKLNGQITRERQQSIGVSEYIWRTAGDERVRQSHREVNGKTFAWGKPPASIGEEPGQPVSCRCVAEAVLPFLADLPPDTLVVP